MTADQLDFDAAFAERDAALAHVEAAADDQDRNVIDQAIRAVAATGRPFTANDVRPLLPSVRTALIGARFAAAGKRGEIRQTGNFPPSTDKGTHGHRLAEWIRV